MTGGDAIDIDMDYDEQVSAFRTINKSEISASVDDMGASCSQFEEEKVGGNNVSKTRVGDFDRSSIGNLESAFDQPSMDDDGYAEMKSMKLQQLRPNDKSRNPVQESNTMKEIIGATAGEYDSRMTVNSQQKLISQTSTVSKDGDIELAQPQNS